MKVFIALFVLVAVASAYKSGDGHHEEYQHHPQYKFDYAVKDTHTHDVKHHNEHRDGDKTEGEYSLVEPDGTTRTVKYHVHGKSGFVATVHRSGDAAMPEHEAMNSQSEMKAMNSHNEMKAMKSQAEMHAMNSQSENHAATQHSGYGNHEEYQQHPQYNFAYAVKDTHSHDIKHHNEHRDGDKTEGEYSLVEPDGTTRTVKYHVHGKSGFIATVHRSGDAMPELHAMKSDSEKQVMNSEHHNMMYSQPEQNAPQKHIYAVPEHHMAHVHYVNHAAPIYQRMIPQHHQSFYRNF